MAAIDTLINVAAIVGGGYVVVAYLLPMLQAQAQTQPTQSDVQSFQDWFSGAFADPALQTEDGLLSELATELSEQELIDKLGALVNGEDEEDDEDSSDDDEEDDDNGSSSKKKKKKKKLTASEQAKADRNKTLKSSRTAESNKKDVELFNKTFWKP